VLLDCTEAVESPSITATVLRSQLSPPVTSTVEKLAGILGAPLIV